jgi:hypothetical protein
MEPGVYREVFWISYHLRSVDGSWIAIIDVIASVFVRPRHNMRNIAVLSSLQYYCQYKQHEACWQHNDTGPGSIFSCRVVFGNCVSMEGKGGRRGTWNSFGFRRIHVFHQEAAAAASASPYSTTANPFGVENL